MNFSVIFKDLRKFNNLNQEEIAKKLNLTRSTVSDWENERSEPSVNQLVSIATAFSCSVDYLLGLEDDFGNIVIAGESDGLTEEEKELIKCYRSSADAERLALITTARSFAKRKTDAKHNVG